MADSPTGRLAKTLDRMRRLVAASATFQALVGELTPAAALDHVYSPEASDSDDWPRANVCRGPDFETKQNSTTTVTMQGSFYLTFDIVVDAANDDTPLAQQNFCENKAGTIIDEMHALVISRAAIDGIATETHLNMVSASIEEGPYPMDVEEDDEMATDEATRQPRWWITYLVRWEN